MTGHVTGHILPLQSRDSLIQLRKHQAFLISILKLPLSATIWAKHNPTFLNECTLSIEQIWGVQKPAYAFSYFPNVILLSNPNSGISRENNLNFGGIEFAIPETQNWLFSRELGSSEFNLRMREIGHVRAQLKWWSFTVLLKLRNIILVISIWHLFGLVSASVVRFWPNLNFVFAAAAKWSGAELKNKYFHFFETKNEF